MVVLLAIGWMAVGWTGCERRQEAVNAKSLAEGQLLLGQIVKEFHNPSAEAHGTEKKRLLREAAGRYERL